jgi:8-hydroxy-5-deazaflavin:NADPH oxidoreductase
MTMRIAVVGRGRVGGAIGEGWKKAGHDVIYGVRSNPAAGEATINEVAAQAEVIAIATPWEAVPAVCASLGPQPGKVIIDCTNPLIMGAGAPVDSHGHALSGGERVQAWRPEAKVFKALNQTGFETLTAPERFAARPVMLVAGDDAAKKVQVLQLVADLGLDPVDAGPLTCASHLEQLARIWIDLAFKRGLGRNFAFSITRT